MKNSPRSLFFLLQWRRALHHSSRRLALGMVILGLCAAVRPWKPISWISRWTVLVLMSFVRYTLQHSAVTFCELVWPTISQLNRCCSLPFPLHNNSTYSWTGQGRNLMNWLVVKVVSYDGAKLKVTDLFNVCLWRLHGCELNFIHLSETGCPHTSVYSI